jgi:hypothetical protein
MLVFKTYSHWSEQLYFVCGAIDLNTIVSLQGGNAEYLILAFQWRHRHEFD